MAQAEAQPNKGQSGRTQVPPQTPPIPKSGASTVTEVAKRELVWPEVQGFHGKQRAENQDDTFGTMVRSIKIVHGKNHEVIGVLQKDGKQVDGVLPTLQRQLTKLALVCYFTNPSAIKARGYHRCAAKYGKDMAKLLGSMATKGYSLECVYGAKARLFADPEVLATFIISIIAMENATTARWPSAEPGVEEVVDEKITEEVKINLL